MESLYYEITQAKEEMTYEKQTSIQMGFKQSCLLESFFLLSFIETP